MGLYITANRLGWSLAIEGPLRAESISSHRFRTEDWLLIDMESRIGKATRAWPHGVGGPGLFPGRATARTEGGNRQNS